MAKMYGVGRLLGSTKQSFTSKEGEYVEYHENDIRTESGVITCNSKDSFAEDEGKEGVFTFEVKEQEKGFKVTLRDFKEGAKISEEGEIEF